MECFFVFFKGESDILIQIMLLFFCLWESTSLIFRGATPYSSCRLHQRKFQSLKKIFSAHSLSGIFFLLQLPDAVPMHLVGEQVSSRGQEMPRLVLRESTEITFKFLFWGTP